MMELFAALPALFSAETAAAALVGTEATATAAATQGLFGAGGEFALGKTLMTGGSILSGVGAIGSGIAQHNAADFRAKQLEANANEERAIAQRKADEARRRADIIGSRAQAVAAASGGGAADPTVIGIMAGIAGEGETNAQYANFMGEERARNAEAAADAARTEGDFARTGGFISGASTMAMGIGKAYAGYKPTPPNGGTIAGDASYNYQLGGGSLSRDPLMSPSPMFQKYADGGYDPYFSGYNRRFSFAY